MLQDGTSYPESIPKDVDEAIDSMSDADWTRLHRAARYLSRPSRLSPDDLLREAFTKALDGTRTYKPGLEAKVFLFGIMRSLVSSDCKAQRRHPETSLDNTMPNSQESFVANVPDPKPTPEQELASQQDADRLKQAVLALFEDDQTAQMVAEGRMEEMSPQDIQELTGLDKKGYASMLRKIRRRIDKAYPEGWEYE